MGDAIKLACQSIVRYIAGDIKRFQVLSGMAYVRYERAYHLVVPVREILEPKG